MAFGLIDTSYIDFPSNVDNAYLRGLQTRSGLDFTALASRVDAALGAVNTGVDPLLAALLAPPTTAVDAPGGRNGTMVVQRKSQYTVARPQVVERTAHMLAIDEFEIALGFTEDGLQEISLDNFQIQVDAMREALERHARGYTLERLFSDAEITVDPVNPTTATSPGFAGSGTGGNAFTGVYPDGSALGGGYTHYFRDTAANSAVVIAAARDRLRKWYPGPFDMVGSAAFIARVMADTTNFVSSGSLLVRPGLGTATTVLDPGQYVGAYLGDIRVWTAINDFTDDVGTVFKSFGQFASNNPLVWRYDTMRGLNAYVRSRVMFPLAEAIGMWKFAPNCNNRTAATLIKIAASGSYVPPTITY